MVLPITDDSGQVETGDYSFFGDESANCSASGTFADLDLYSFSPIGVKISQTAYTNQGDVSGGWVYAYDPNNCNCSCRAANHITRAENAPYWVIDQVAATIFGVNICPQVLVDQASSFNAACGDITILPH